MKGRGSKFIAKAAFWLVAEIALNCIGLDDLADYSEFVFEKNSRHKSELCLAH